MEGRPHVVQRRSHALDVLSCEEISSSDSSDSSNEENQARHVYAEGSNFRPPASPALQFPGNSDDSDSKPFDVTNFEDIVRGLTTNGRKSTDNVHSAAGAKSSEDFRSPDSCFYGLSEHCLDASNNQPKCEKSSGVWSYIKAVCGCITRCETTNTGVVTTFRPWFVFTFACLMLALALFNVEDPMFGTMFIVILSAAYIFQHTLMNRRKPAKNPTLCNRLIQKFLDITIHNVMPCSTCKDQFTQQGIFEFHNRVAARLLKSHTCSAPYSGYDYLVAYLVWTMDRAMLELRGEGFMTVDPCSSRENRTTPCIDPPHGTGLRASMINTNNSNSNMDYQPVPSSDESDYETPSGSSESNTSMDYLVLSQESSDSEGYESALHQNSATTSMNVNNDDDVTTTTTEHDDFTTFSLYTARSSVTTDTYDDDEEEEEDYDGSECVNASTTVSPNFTSRTDPSCNGSEPTQQGSEDTTRSQFGSELTRDGTSLTKSTPNSSRRNERAQKSTNSVAMGDNALVNQLIAHSVKEHLVISPAASVDEMLQHGFEQMAESSYTDADIYLQSPYDTMNMNNNGNTFARSRTKYRSALDEEANIDGYGEFSNDDSDSDEDDDYSNAAFSTTPVPCTMTEESDVQLTYSIDSWDDHLDESATLDRISKLRGISPDVEQQLGNNYFRNSPKQQPRRFDCGDIDENKNATNRAPAQYLPTFGTIMHPDAMRSRSTTNPSSGCYPDSSRSRKHPDGKNPYAEIVYVFPKPEKTYPYCPNGHKTLPQHYSPRQY